MAIEQMLEDNWNTVRSKLQQRWSQFSDQDLENFRGNLDALVGEIQHRTGESQEAIRQFLEESAGETGGAMHRTFEAARGYAADTTRSIQAASEQMADRFRSGYVGAGQYIRQRPGQMLATAFAAGLLMGVTLGLVLRTK